MRTITINNKEFDIRSLSRGELKELRHRGFNILALTAENLDDGIDAVFEMMFEPEEIAAIDAMENKQAGQLWAAIIAETYGAPDEEKNL